MSPLTPPIITLDEALLDSALATLTAGDPLLAHAYQHFGRPPMWARPPGFATLVHIVLEQQVSLASARAAFDKLREHLGTIDPATFLALDDATLKSIGFSRQKSRYCRLIAEAVDAGDLDLAALSALPDPEVEKRLTAIVGIGPWTARIYLLMVLCRPDVWPRGDIALASAHAELSGAAKRTPDATLAEIAEAWRPWRAVAARVLWHSYLSTPRRKRRA